MTPKFIITVIFFFVVFGVQSPAILVLVHVVYYSVLIVNSNRECF
jgi:hypothetical protein